MNDKKNIIKKIQEQEMDRKSFLKVSGLVVLSLVGAKTIVNLLVPTADVKTTPKANATRGFGSGKYGA